MTVKQQFDDIFIFCPIDLLRNISLFKSDTFTFQNVLMHIQTVRNGKRYANLNKNTN